MPEKTKDVFISLSVFEGKDFSNEVVGFINNISQQETNSILEHYASISLIEHSKADRYRIHPMIRAFAKRHLIDTTVYLRVATFYEQLLIHAQTTSSQKQLMQDVDNIIYVFKKCYDYGYWDQVITLWNPIEKFLSDVNELKKLRLLTHTIDTAPSINNLQKILNYYVGFLFIYWVFLLGSGMRTEVWNYLFSFGLGLPPFVGGLIGILRARTWGLLNTNIGKAVIFISGGLFSWGVGNQIWVYYNFFQHVAIPYPSFADAGFFPAYFLWITGIIYLSKATGAKFIIKMKRSRLLLLVNIVVACVSYFFLLYVVKRTFVLDNFVTLFFDLYYPSMDIIILTLAVSIFGLSVNFFGGKYKLSLFFMLAGCIFLYFADFSFSYTTSQQSYYNGNIADLSFAIAFYLMTWGTLSFYITPKKLRQ